MSNNIKYIYIYIIILYLIYYTYCIYYLLFNILYGMDIIVIIEIIVERRGINELYYYDSASESSISRR